jgi:hypothetical protein
MKLTFLFGSPLCVLIFRSFCAELWGVVENGYEPVDERNMSLVENINCQLNSTTLDKILQSLKRDTYDQVVNIESA